VLTKAEYGDATYGNISKQIGEKFLLTEIVPTEKKTGTHYIFVCGLAGDYCVKDTALNLAKDITANGYKNIKVVILQPFTRYAFLPLQYVGGNQVYANAVLANTSAANTTFSNTSKPKDINHYIFKLGAEYKLLSKEEAAAAAENIKKIKPANGTSNPNLYAAFLTPTKDIISDYGANGIMIAMSEPSLSSMTGGARRRRHSKRKTHRRRRLNKRKSTRRHK